MHYQKQEPLLKNLNNNDLQQLHLQHHQQVLYAPTSFTRKITATHYGYALGSKRGYYDDGYEDQSYQYGEREDREPKRGMYESQCMLSIEPPLFRYCGALSYLLNDGYILIDESRRYGLGSEERRGPTSTAYMNAGPVIQDELMVPSHMVGMVIGRGGDSLRRIERLSGAKVQFAEGKDDTPCVVGSRI